MLLERYRGAQGPGAPPPGYGHPSAARASRPRRGIGPARPALPLAYTCAAPASGTGHLTRSRPQDSASNVVAPQWEPRKPLGGTRKPRRGRRVQRGLSEICKQGLARPGPPASFDPSDQSRKRILTRKAPARSRGQSENRQLVIHCRRIWWGCQSSRSRGAAAPTWRLHTLPG